MSNSDAEQPSPKRQRLNSYSPASPGCPSPKRQRGEQPFIQTPPPSVRMSPSWQSQSQNIQHQSGGSNFPSPPSTAGYQNRMAEGGGDSGRQTPASQDDCELRRDGHGDAVMSDRPGGVDTEITMADPEHRRSDHERLGTGGVGEVEKLPLYKLFTDPVPPSRPHPTQNLIELYDLKRIQTMVLRRDPVTGAKINVMRKSYANKLKALGLEGKNKANPNQGELSGLVDPGWNNEVAPDVTWWDQTWSERGKLGDASAESDLLSKLDSALSMEPGQLPPKEHETWKGILGLDDPAASAKGAAAPNANKPSSVINPLARTSAAHAIHNSAPASPRNQRQPDRKGKKRSYDDSSFEGYNQGYEDDGYSTGGVDEGRRRDSNKRQKRKEFPSQANSPAFNTSGAVGVRSS